MRIETRGGPRREWPIGAPEVEPSRAQLRPFEQFVLKVNSRCNLSCTYCYMYEGPDQSWRRQPVRMSDGTVEATARRIGDHAEAHSLERIEVVLHGGEPLLAGSKLLASVCEAVRVAVPSATKVDISLQTNGALLADEVLTVLGGCGVRVGVSLDGDAAAHDAKRINAANRGSHSDVLKGLALLRSPRHREMYAGLLCVVDPTTDPVATYESLLAHEPPAIDFLLPHANWSHPPARPRGGSPTAYGDWLVSVFDRWYGASEPETSLRFFEEIMRGLLGRPSRVETIGLSPVRMVVVETDGAIEQSDALKMAYEGAASTGLNVHRASFDEALVQPGFVARQIGVDALSESCRRCELHPVCGGGCYSHRYEQGTGFLNPSVYCDDLAVLIRHVRQRMQADLAVAAQP